MFWAPDETVSVTDSRVPCPFAERAGRFWVLVRADPLVRFAVEGLRRLAERPLAERPVERLLVAVAERDREAFDDARPPARRLDPLLEEDLEELDEVPWRWDDLGWAMRFSYLQGNTSLNRYPGREQPNPLAGAGS